MDGEGPPVFTDVLTVTDEPGPMSPTTAAAGPALLPDAALPAVTLLPVVPKHLGRYEAADKYVKAYGFTVAPLLFCDPLDPIGLNRREHWERHIHPEGNPYFYHRGQQVVTLCDTFDDDVNDCVKAVVAEIGKRMRVHRPQDSITRDLPSSRPDVEVQIDQWHYGIPEWELCINVVDVKTGECRYYVADWSKRCVFWLEDDSGPDTTPADSESNPGVLDLNKLKLKPQSSWDHLRTMFEGHFWKHAEFFPCHRNLPAGSLDELKAWCLWATIDRLTCYDSTVSSTVEDLQIFMQLFDYKWDHPLARGSLHAAVARLWNTRISVDRQHNLHGEHSARLSRHQSRFSQAYHHYTLHWTLHLISKKCLFGQPRKWYLKFCQTWIDNSVYRETWLDMMREIHEEWKGTGFMATVILAANMGFLTINPFGNDHTASAITARTLSIISTITSIGTIMSSMLLSHGHQDLAQPSRVFSESGALTYLETCEKRPTGLFGAAMLVSIPFAMLLWSLVAFMGAILAFSFAQWSHFASPFIAFMVALVFGLILWQLFFFGGRTPEVEGSDWTVTPEDNKPRPSPPRPGPGILKMRTFSRLPHRTSTLFSTSSLHNMRRRGSDLVKRLSGSFRQSSPRSTVTAHDPASPNPVILSSPGSGTGSTDAHSPTSVHKPPSNPTTPVARSAETRVRPSLARIYTSILHRPRAPTGDLEVGVTGAHPHNSIPLSSLPRASSLDSHSAYLASRTARAPSLPPIPGIPEDRYEGPAPPSSPASAPPLILRFSSSTVDPDVESRRTNSG